MSWWTEFRDHQDSEPEDEDPKVARKKRMREARNKAKMIAEGFTMLDPTLKIEPPNPGFWRREHLAFLVVKNDVMRIQIQIFGDHRGTQYSFYTGCEKLGEQHVAELIGVAKRF